MLPIDFFKLIFLAAIWGGSFIFLRIATPELGAVATATLRILLAGVSLVAFAYAIRVTLAWRRNLKPYLVVGLFAAALPFSLFSYAALHLPAAYSALLNSTSPLFGAVFSVFYLAERLTLQKLSGLALGVAGVGVLVGAGALVLNAGVLLSIAACLGAAACYAISSIIVKKTGRPHSGVSGGIHPIAMAAGSMACGGALMAPTLLFYWPAALPSQQALWSVAGMAFLSSGLAQALFIPLIVRIGPTRAMSVSFLIPLFSMLWGYLFLNEAVRVSTLVGAAIVMAAMWLVLTAKHPEPEDALSVEA